MRIVILGAAGFIGTNLTMKLAEDSNNEITIVDVNKEYFKHIAAMNLQNVRTIEFDFNADTNFERVLAGQQVVYHLVSTTIPTTSNQQIAQELAANVVMTARLLDSCVACGVTKVVFLSSGGTVYGKEAACPLKEDTATNPISSYGIQKVTIEKLLYLYWYMYGLDYRVIRLANPYGPYQRPNGLLGAVTTFTYKALMDEEILVYGDGSVVRDFIYIDDAIRGILKIANGESKHRTFNLGSGYGTSIKQVLRCVAEVLGKEPSILYKEGRKVDVPMNYLDISRYEKAYGELKPLSLTEGIRRTAEFLEKHNSL